MKKKVFLNLFLLIVLIFTFIGCAATIRTQKDEFSGLTVTGLERNSLKAGGFPVSNTFQLNVFKFSYKDGKVEYSLGVHYLGDTVQIIEGGSLQLKIDGELVTLFTKEPKFEYGSYTNVSKEDADYGISSDILKKIANSREVKVRLVGSEKIVDTEFTEENFQNYKKFVAEYVK